MSRQGKRHEQIRFSNLMVLIGFIGLVITLVWGMYLFADHTKSESGPPQDYWLPITSDTLTEQDSLELKEPDAIYYDTISSDNMLDVDMDCGGESIPRYDRFADVPAGAEDKIIVDDILYKINNNKTKWIPVYPDEYIRWIGSNGDTIWE